MLHENVVIEKCQHLIGMRNYNDQGIIIAIGHVILFADGCGVSSVEAVWVFETPLFGRIFLYFSCS